MSIHPPPPPHPNHPFFHICELVFSSNIFKNHLFYCTWLLKTTSSFFLLFFRLGKSPFCHPNKIAVPSPPKVFFNQCHIMSYRFFKRDFKVSQAFLFTLGHLFVKGRLTLLEPFGNSTEAVRMNKVGNDAFTNRM